jgi:hypothetical protein
MITFTRFIVVPQDANAIDDESQPVFEDVARTGRWLRQAPNDDLSESFGIQHMPFVDQQLSRHV